MKQSPLFDDEPEPPPEPAAPVPVRIKPTSRPLSPAQKQFNRLIARIEGQRRLLAEWEAYLPQFRAQVAQQMEPLQRRLDEQRRALLQVLDAAHDGPGLTRRERDKLAAVIVDIAEEMLSRADDEQVLASHDKHAERSHAESKQEDAELLKAMAEEMFGERLDELEAASSPDEVLEALHERLRRADGKHGAEDEGGDEPTPAPPPPPRNARAAARQAREAAQAQAATQSMRDVYRKLVSALHPDREPDPAERERKTALMQRANQAYERQDLLQLLEIQAESTQIDAQRLAGVGETQLRHYIAVLKEQADTLDAELRELTGPLTQDLPSRRGGVPTPDALRIALQSDLALLKQHAADMRRDIEAFRDPRALKAWLRQVRLHDAPAVDPFAALEALGEMVFAEAPPRRRRRR